MHQRQLRPLKCTVWCGIMADRVIGPYFFEDDDEYPQTISGTVYRTMLEIFLRPAVPNNLAYGSSKMELQLIPRERQWRFFENFLMTE